MFYDVIIIGAGAAGFMAAIEAAKRKRKVLLIDHSPKIGEKIRISGGGRCNFTNINASYENYISANPNFCRSALANYSPENFISLVKSHHIPYHEKKLGQLFCDHSSGAIIEMLYKEADKYGVEIINPCRVDQISKEDKGFVLRTTHDDFQSESLIIATGGLSIPKIGATDFGYKIAREFGLNIVKMRPGLVPLIIEDKFIRSQAGTSFDASVSCGKIKFRENILFTHNGLSGPAILQISNYLQEDRSIKINLCPDLDLKKILLEAKQSGEKKKLKNILKEIKFIKTEAELKTKIQRENIFPDKFVELLAETIDLDKSIAEANNKIFDELALSLQNWQLETSGDEGYAKAEVTLGGIDTKELDSKTMESKKIPGLYFIGELVDVTGWLGGYNFQWAWSSGYAAGQKC